ncbi:MAG: translation initiation factor IF-1 [Hyphococcus sp.]
MAKEELFEFDGNVTEVLPDGNYRVALDSGRQILAYVGGKMRKYRIKTLAGDRVTVEMSAYDLTKGRITFRHKPEGAVKPSSAKRQNAYPRRGRR